MQGGMAGLRVMTRRVGQESWKRRWKEEEEEEEEEERVG